MRISIIPCPYSHTPDHRFVLIFSMVYLFSLWSGILAHEARSTVSYPQSN
jgi:hypothetical protein